ncbi:MAG: TolC family protein [Endomicrobium sp.]|jgi:outer membrane protein TolC|nr:TolC family protein [Endomicrobium sp.]
MKKNVCIFALMACICFFSSLVQSQMVEEILTEDVSIQRALSSNIELLEAAQDIDFASQKIVESKILYFPNFDFNLNCSHFNNSVLTLVSDSMSQAPILLPDRKQDLRYSARISVWQNIYTGGRIKTANKLTKINKEKTENERDIIKNKIINNVKLIFNECLYYRELLKIDIAKLRSVELGRMQLSSENIKKLRRKCIEEQLSFEKELLNLLAVMGKDINSIVRISGKAIPKIKQLDFDKCLFLAYQFKPELKSSQSQEKLDSLSLNLLSLQKFPKITLGAAQEWLGARLFKDDMNWYISLNANIPIFDGGSLFTKIKQGRIKIRQSVLARAKAEREVRLSISKSFLEYNFWRKRAIDAKLLEKKHYDEDDIELIRNLNRSYCNLEFAVGVDLDSY